MLRYAGLKPAIQRAMMDTAQHAMRYKATSKYRRPATIPAAMPPIAKTRTFKPTASEIAAAVPMLASMAATGCVGQRSNTRS
jgi:hypothetical protein